MSIRASLLALLLVGCSPCEPGPLTRIDLPRIDHVIVGVDNLERGIAEIERRTGVRPIIGGVHPGAGTRNALLSLGEGTYLEIIAPNPAEPVASAEVEQLRALKRTTPIGWAVSARDADALRSTMQSTDFPLTPPEPGSRRKPDGTLLSWVTFGFANFDHPLAPFFIVWGEPSKHPSRTSPAGCTLQSLNLRDPAANPLRRAIEPLHVPVNVGQSAKSGMKLILFCPRGAVTFG
ncbi:MAG: VOC family protein [Sphingomicrobium sp.]